MLYLVSLIILGIFAGGMSGLVGIGGGVVIVPALVFLFGFSQQLAQGTTLALLVPPIGVLAAWSYYRHGMVDLRVALLVCLGFVLGSLIGARFAIHLPTQLLSRIFGIFLIAVALKMILAQPL